MSELSTIPAEPLRANQDSEVQLRTLSQDYAISGSALMTELLEVNSQLFDLMREAVQPLHEAFGRDILLRARAQQSDEDSFVKVAVHTSVGDPEESLRSFDSNWWLGNCHRSGGALVFDYQILDGV